MHGSAPNPTPSAPGCDEDTVDNKAPPLKAKSQGAPTAQLNFREGSKLAAVMALLRREGGVTIDEISAAMNWLPHSTRAVLTGLRKRGALVARRKTPDQRASAYVIETGGVSANGQV